MPTNIPARDPAVAETDAAAVAPARARLRPYVTKSLSLARPRRPLATAVGGGGGELSQVAGRV